MTSMIEARPLLAALAAVLLVVAACADGGAPAGTSDARPTAAGSPLPSETFEEFDGGGQTSFADHVGQPLVVNFWASWCPPCIDEMPALEAVHQGLEGEVAFLGINTRDDRAEARRLAEETGVTYDLTSDPSGDLARAFGVFSMPSTYLVSADGRIVHEHAGPLTEERLRELIREHLAP